MKVTQGTNFYTQTFATAWDTMILYYTVLQPTV